MSFDSISVGLGYSGQSELIPYWHCQGLLSRVNVRLLLMCLNLPLDKAGPLIMYTILWYSRYGCDDTSRLSDLSELSERSCLISWWDCTAIDRLTYSWSSDWIRPYTTSHCYNTTKKSAINEIHVDTVIFI